MLWGGIFPDLNNGVRNLIWRGGGPNIFTIVEIGNKKKKKKIDAKRIKCFNEMIS